MAKQKKTKATESRPSALLTPILRVRDTEGASRFYQLLGFRQEMAFPQADGRLAIAFLKYDTCYLMLGRQDETHYENEERLKLINKGPYGLGVVLMLGVTDLEKVYNAVKKAGVAILLEPVNEFYGDRVFMFLDPDGYEWKISQPIEKVDMKDVADIIRRS